MSEKKEKIKLCQFQLDLQGVPNWVLALNIHSMHLIILNVGLKDCYNKGIER